MSRPKGFVPPDHSACDGFCPTRSACRGERHTVYVVRLGRVEAWELCERARDMAVACGYTLHDAPPTLGPPVFDRVYESHETKTRRSEGHRRT